MKKILVFVLLFIFSFSSTPSSAAILGDYTGEGQITTDDVVFLLAWIQSGRTSNTTLIRSLAVELMTTVSGNMVNLPATGVDDFNGDTSVTTDDVVFLLAWIQAGRVDNATLVSNLAVELMSTVKGPITKFPGSTIGTTTPVNKDFEPPAGYTTAGYPALTSPLAVTGFGTSNTLLVAVMNRSSSAVTVSLGGAMGSIRTQPQAWEGGSLPTPSLTSGERLHLNLRDFEIRLPKTVQPSVRKSVAVRPDAVGDNVTFNIYGITGVPTITAQCKKVAAITGFSNKLNLYFDVADTYDTTASNLLDQLIASWSAIYTKNRQIFGAEPPPGFQAITSDDITVLLSSKIDSAGYFYSGDMYLPSQIQGGISNQRKMFYLQYNTTGLRPFDLQSTMAHEFQHMINFYRRKLKSLTEDSWLNEAMSGYAEYVNGFTFSAGNQSKALQSRDYLAAVQSVGLTTWSGSHENYGSVFLFGTWFAQNFGTSGAVTALLDNSSKGTAAIAAVAGQTFDTVFAKYALALYVNDASKAPYGIDGVDVKTTYSFPGNLADVTLSGPALKTGAIPYSSGNFTIAPYATAYVQLTGNTAGTVNLTLPTGVTCFQLMK